MKRKKGLNTMNELKCLKKISVYVNEDEYADLDALRAYLGFAKKSDFYKALMQEGFRIFAEGYKLGDMLMEKTKEEALPLTEKKNGIEKKGA